MNIQDKWNEMLCEKRHQLVYPSEHVIQAVFRNFLRGGKILDLGCGAGRHVKFLAENGYDAYGCDFSQNGIYASKNLLDSYNLKADLRVASVDSLPYSDNFFDGLICLGVLFYNDINIIEKAASEIRRVLKHKAKAYITLRNIDDYRYQDAIKNTKYDTIIVSKNTTTSADKEDSMRTYFFDKCEVWRVFADFSEIEINTSRVSIQNDTKIDSFLFVTLTK